jgi:hypothetical protein
MAARALTQLASDPDQPSRRAELLAFIGPNPKSFLTLYQRLVADTAAKERRLTSLVGGLCAPAFFLGPVWFFYRKMWLWASGYCVVMVLLAMLSFGGQTGLVLSVIAALVARLAYLDHAARTIAKLRRTHPVDERMYLTQLAEAGGVSKLAGWISGVFFAAVLAVATYAALHPNAFSM